MGGRGFEAAKGKALSDPSAAGEESWGSSTGLTEDTREAGVMEEADIPEGGRQVQDRNEKFQAPPRSCPFAGVCQFQSEGQDLPLNRQLPNHSARHQQAGKEDSGEDGSEK